MPIKICLWPSDRVRSGGPQRARLSGAPGFELVDRPDRHERYAFVHTGALSLETETIRWAAAELTDELLVSVAPRTDLKWHLWQAQRILFRDDWLIWAAPGIETHLPAGLPDEIRLELGVHHDGRQIHCDVVTVAPCCPLPGCRPRVIVGDSPVSAGHVLHQFRPGPLPEGARVDVLALDPLASEGTVDRYCPASLPGYTDFDSAAYRWTNHATGAAIAGRQDAPTFLAASPALIVGTVQQFRTWRERLARGEARAIRLSAAEAALAGDQPPTAPAPAANLNR